jgi:outer membrane protein assembly factor BamB
VLLAGAIANKASAASADEIIKSSGVRGGLVVVLGSDADLLGGFGDGYIVQGIDGDRKRVEEARTELRSKGRTGPVTVKFWNGTRLPYTDGIVNLLVSFGERRVADEEIHRVLAPRGVAIVNGKTSVQPVPEEIDEWSHYLHGPDNNAVAADSLVGPPRYLKWTGGPKYSRNHEIDSSVVALVSSKGRFFYVVDEGPPGFMGKYLPQQWALVTRDAFNGAILWRVPMPEMGWPQWKPVMSDTDWSKLVAQRRLIPITLPRRVVAAGDRVFAVLGYHEPLCILDAATGETLRTVDGTNGTDEILFHNGILTLTVRPHSRGSLDKKERALALINRSDRTVTNHPGSVVAVDPDSGKLLWKVSSDKLLPLSLTAGGDRVFYHTGSEVVALDHLTGRQLWRTANENAASFRWNVNHTLVAHNDILLVGTPKKLEALSAETGELVWEGPGGRSGFAGANPVNIYVIDGLVWSPAGARRGSVAEGRDIRTGEVVRTIELPAFMYTAGHHFRCYRGKATERYLLENKRGIEMIDIKGDNFVKNDWVRGICRYGILPANGMIYSTPTPCSCYPAAQLTGFNALAPHRSGRDANAAAPRLVRGPAYDASRTPQSAARDTQNWPCYRGNPLRTGKSSTTVPTKLKPKWQTELSGKLTQPIVANGKLFVASVDQHTVHAVDADSGKMLWSFTVDGRVDSPPTYDGGMLYFGSANGWIYSLLAADGRLAWRYQVAPGDDQIVAYNQLESVWPARGSAMVLDGIVYAAAGRNSYLDGGIKIVALDTATGKLLHESVLSNAPQDPATDASHHNMIDGAQLDVLSSNGKHVYMQWSRFDLQLNRLPADTKPDAHIIASGGFVDDLAWNRNAWRCSASTSIDPQSKKSLGTAPCTGQVLVQDGDHVYGVKYFLGHSGQSSVFYPGQDGYQLFRHRVGDQPASATKGKRKKVAATSASTSNGWTQMLPVRINAMTQAHHVLFVAGTPDVIDSKDPMAALEGRKGGKLLAISTADGTTIAEWPLESPPVFDGLMAANNRLYLCTTDSRVICFEGVK